MRIFKDLDLVEQLGTGIIRILKSYDKDVYEFSDNFIRVNFKFRDRTGLSMSPRDIDYKENKLTETQKNIIKLIKKDNKITLNKISDELGVNRSTIVRNLKILKDNGVLKRVGSDRDGYWSLLEGKD